MIRIFDVIRSRSLLFIFCAILLTTHLNALQGDECLGLTSQNEMNSCEERRYRKAETDLNQIYRKLLVKYKSDEPFIIKVKAAQRAWLTFRDAYLNSIYYKNDTPQAYGSVYPTCRAILLTRLTIERTTELKQMLNPQEGDVCGFSGAISRSRLNNKAPKSSRSGCGPPKKETA